MGIKVLFPSFNKLFFCKFLIKNGVVAVPGTAFQAPDFIRISTAADEATVTEGVRRIVAATGELT